MWLVEIPLQAQYNKHGVLFFVEHLPVRKMKTYGSDIEMYGATNPTEFFAVISEYFFERPDLLKTNHPDLYEMLGRIYKTEG